MPRNFIFKTIPFLFLIILFNSCDKEFNVIGEDIIGDSSFDIKKEEFQVVAYNQQLAPIQSNNMPVNALGIYDNPSFGTTTANFVTQVSLTSLGTTFADVTKVKSVVLSIPYFVDSSKTVLDTGTGNSTYVLDSIHGPALAKMKLSIYESGYYMSDLDPEEQYTQPQKFYTNQYSEFNAKKGSVLLNNSTINTAENSQFFFDPAEIVTKDANGVVTARSAPAMKLNLNVDFFQSKIMGAPASKLANNDAFKEYFRGLFFNIERNGSDPTNLAMINFAKGTITITYTETVNSVDTDKTFVLNLTGNTVSLLDQSNTNVNYADAINPSNINKVSGDANLYIKGGEGSMSILKLFSTTDNHGLQLTDAPNGVPDELDDMRRNKYLVNEANLVFYLNSDAMGESSVPQRIYLYDFTNSKVLYDYSADGSTAGNSKYDKYVFGGILDKKTATNGGGPFYKVRITNHIRNLIKNVDSTNVDLGLVVTEDINRNSFNVFRDKTIFPYKAPLASVMNPLGAIIFGNNIPFDDKNYKKRLKFEIYYTKAN